MKVVNLEHPLLDTLLKDLDYCSLDCVSYRLNYLLFGIGHGSFYQCKDQYTLKTFYTNYPTLVAKGRAVIKSVYQRFPPTLHPQIAKLWEESRLHCPRTYLVDEYLDVEFLEGSFTNG